MLKTQDARLVQVYDGDGELAGMLIRLTDRLWGFSAKGDPDWEDHKRNVAIED